MASSAGKKVKHSFKILRTKMFCTDRQDCPRFPFIMPNTNKVDPSLPPPFCFRIVSVSVRNYMNRNFISQKCKNVTSHNTTFVHHFFKSKYLSLKKWVYENFRLWVTSPYLFEPIPRSLSPALAIWRPFFGKNGSLWSAIKNKILMKFKRVDLLGCFQKTKNLIKVTVT